jgi:hypothetical protein
LVRITILTDISPCQRGGYPSNESISLTFVHLVQPNRPQSINSRIVRRFASL